jgi:nicotinamidase/pyrazinamidase
VQYTRDAELHPELHSAQIDLIQQKGENKNVDSYSAFRDNDQYAVTGLADFLVDQGVTELDVCGLATDYCVKFSALDALELIPGVKVRFIEDASRGISPEGVAEAIDEMRGHGIDIVNSADILAA